jgi:Alpha/beta hydrolase domain
MRRRRLVLPAGVGSFLLISLLVYPVAVLGTGIAAAVPGATVSGPMPVPNPTFNTTLQGNGFDLSQVGYESSQFFVSGTAHTYAPAPGTSLTPNGQWSVTTDQSATYKTRIAVYRPIDPNKFNGTVIVEWLNVSGGIDDSPDWTLSHNELVRDGFAWVGVSAQAVGVNAAKAIDPATYSSLSHPGDSYSYDIFSQAGQAIRDDASQILGGLTPRKVIAAGESQSAGRLMTYIDAVQPVTHAYDGFLVHSQFGTGAPLSQAPEAPSVPAPTPTTIRSDLGVPVLEFETQTDVAGSNLTDRLFFGDPSNFRLWEVAGSSHFDYYGLEIGPTDTGNGQGAVANLAAMQNPPSSVSGFSCTLPINTGGTHWVLNAAVASLNQWVVNGTPAPQPPYLQTTQSSPVVFALDSNGNAAGGVRSPQVDAPIAALGGVGSGPTFCFLFGTTVPFSAAHLADLYKNHGQFVSAWNQATQTDVKAGYILPADATELKVSAASSQIGK